MWLRLSACDAQAAVGGGTATGGGYATANAGARPCAPTIDGNFGFPPNVHFFNGLLSSSRDLFREAFLASVAKASEDAS